jgi:putative flippase GtrA
MIRRRWLLIFVKFIKYFLVALLFFLLYIFFLRLLTDILLLNYLLSATISFILTWVGGFLFHKYYTFGNKSKKHTKQLFLFGTFLSIGLLFDLLILKIWVKYLGFYYLYVAVFSKGVTFVWNFLMNHYFNFK